MKADVCICCKRKFTDILKAPIMALNISVRARNAFRHENTVEEILNFTEKEIFLNRRNVGKKTSQEIKSFLQEHNLNFKQEKNNGKSCN